MESFHVPESMTNAIQGNPVDFAWLELTNRCNLQCSHCYTSSSPTSTERDILTHSQYVDVIHQLYMLGCRKIQFIGGEPTLNKGIPRLIDTAKDCGYDFVEVFTNLVSLPDSLLKKLVERNIAIATSFYSWDRKVHDRITGQIGSFEKTVRNIKKRVLGSGLTLRAGIILMDENRDQLADTWAFLERLGVERIGSDNIRKFGRALEDTSCSMGELCGSCAGNILSIGPDGVVAPCNMSRHWSVGNVLEKPLAEIVHSDELASVRHRIGDAVRERSPQVEAICDPKTCAPYSVCCPSTQSCGPCSPNGCTPCYPKG